MQPPQIPPSDPDYVRATVALVDWDQASVPWALSPLGRAHARRAYQNAPRMAALNAGRELTSVEVEAFMELSFNMLSAQNVAGTVCTALPAYYFWRRGMARFSFPFWRPEGGGATRIDPDTLRFPLQPRPVLTGVRARAAWHGLRFVAYWITAALMAGGAASAVAAGVVAGRGNTDPRLEQWRADCLARAASAANKQQQQQPMLPLGFPRPSPAPFPRPQQQQQQQPSYGGDDNASSWRPDDDGAPLSNPAPRPAQPRPRQDSDGFDDPFDDGSPVAPSYRGPSSAGPDTGGSAWDRLRRESANRAAGQGNQQASTSWDAKRASAARGGGGGNDESWSYSNPGGSEADTDRERAQKEFDGMLERERRSQSGGRS